VVLTNYTLKATLINPHITNCLDTATIRLYDFHVDIDNENHWGGDYFTTNFMTTASRALRDQVGRDKSKILFVNDIDKDGSGTPDFMDGWGCNTMQIPLLERENTSGTHRSVNPDENFVPMIVTVDVPALLLNKVRVKFDYPESPPSSMCMTNYTWAGVGPANNAPVSRVHSPVGKIRVWRINGDESRFPMMDYIGSNKPTPLYYLALGDNAGMLFLEAINPSQDWSDIRINVSLSIDEGNTWPISKAVRVTSMRCNYTMGVVRPYYQKGSSGTRIEFVPDYSTPAASMRAFADAKIQTMTYAERKIAQGGQLDTCLHEGEDAPLGHGFAYFQYEGPDLGNDLSLQCSFSQYDHKFFFGKTGNSGLTHWDYGSGRANNPNELAWWDICSYKLNTPSSKFLVLKKSYTLNPNRASALFDIFFQEGLYDNYNTFGLHIQEDVKGWGCLSNVALAMRSNQLDTAKMEQCLFSKNMPTTANASVWAIIMGKKKEMSKDKAGLDLMKNVIDVVVDETQGEPWGGTKKITQNQGGALQEKLLNALKYHEIRLRDVNAFGGMGGTTTIYTLNDILLEEGITDHLEYYDPGLFPVVFGEQPKSMFNMEESE
jgi:hypothetical protein